MTGRAKPVAQLAAAAAVGMNAAALDLCLVVVSVTPLAYKPAVNCTYVAAR